MTHPLISDFQEGQSVVTFLLVREKQLLKTKAGKAYLNLDLIDRTGKIRGMVWDNADKFSAIFEKGDIIKIKASVEKYRDSLQLKIQKIRTPTGDEDDVPPLSEFQPRTPFDINEMFEQFSSLILTVDDPHILALFESFLQDEDFIERFKYAIAARDVHHNYIGGLLEHCLSMLQIADFMASHYPDVDRSLLFSGIFFHDIGKLEELDSSTEFNYTVKGGLIGHISIGVQMVNERIRQIDDFPGETRMLIEHLILSHHGELEFGSPVTPKTREAVILHYIDNMDSKFFITHNSITQDANLDDDFTRKNFYMNRRFYKPREKQN